MNLNKSKCNNLRKLGRMASLCSLALDLVLYNTHNSLFSFFSFLHCRQRRLLLPGDLNIHRVLKHFCEMLSTRCMFRSPGSSSSHCAIPASPFLASPSLPKSLRLSQYKHPHHYPTKADQHLFVILAVAVLSCYALGLLDQLLQRVCQVFLVL